MAQNWWEMFPEIQPSPAARPRLLPGPGDAMARPAMGRPIESFGTDQAPPGAFDPSYFSGGGRLDGSQSQVTPSSSGQQPFSGDDGAPAMDRNAAIQHAASAIQRGADPEAVRARLNQMGHTDLDPPSPFSDLIPDDGTRQAGAAIPAYATERARNGMGLGGPQGLANGSPVAQASQVRFHPSVEANPRNGSPAEKSRALETYKSARDLKPPPPTSQSRRAVLGPPRGADGRGRPVVNVNGYGFAPSAGDSNLLARALFAEFSTANNWQDMVAGAWSMLNRIRPNGHWPRYRTRDTIGTSLADVLTKRVGHTPQYSFMSPGGIGAPGGSRQWQRSAHPDTLDGGDRQAWTLAMRIAQGVLSGNIPDPTGGATHFYNRLVDPGYFRAATSGPHPRLAQSPYRSPTGENFFFRTTEDRPRPVGYRGGPLHLTVPPQRH